MKAETKEAWFRILVLIITGIILSLWRGIIVVISILHWLVVLFTAKRNRKLANFCEYYNSELYKFSKYLTFVTNERPFPFSDVKRLSKFQ